MSDAFATYSPGLDSPGTRHFLITPGPGDIVPRPRSIYCQVAGNVTIQDVGGTALTYAMVAGQILPFRAQRVTAATATIYGWD